MSNPAPLEAARAVLQQAEMIQAEREAGADRAAILASKLELARGVERGRIALTAGSV